LCSGQFFPIPGPGCQLIQNFPEGIGVPEKIVPGVFHGIQQGLGRIAGTVGGEAAVFLATQYQRGMGEFRQVYIFHEFYGVVGGFAEMLEGIPGILFSMIAVPGKRSTKQMTENMTDAQGDTDSGCSSVVALTSITMMGIIALGAICLKKKD